jgi:uncharacterized protein (DUF2147 family)
MRALLLTLALALPAHAARPADPTGLWWAEGGSAQVEIYACESALCGRIAWLRHPFDEHGCPQTDSENPDPLLRERDMVGVQLFSDLRTDPDEPDVWRNGTVYDPTSGRTYSAEARLDSPDRLRLRGYLGIRLLGRTTTWFRVNAEPRCEVR